MEKNIAIIYAVRDELTGTFFTPIFLKGDNTLKQAERVFGEMVNNNPIWKNNPNDFGLYQIGTFNENTGIIKNESNSEFTIEKINSGVPYVRKEQA